MLSSFAPFGSSHCVVILLTLAIPAAALFLSRNGARREADIAVRAVLGSLLLLNYLGYAFQQALRGVLRWQEMLPFQLCDWTMIVILVALLNGGRKRWLEPAYFWGIGGSLQAIVTPNLQVGFPDIRFISFFVDHCGIVISVVYLMLSRHFRPGVGSIWRTLLWSEIYLAVTLLVDQITGVNYGFLLHKPEAFSILSYLSDSRLPYLLQLNLLALVFFAVLYLPFALADLCKGELSADAGEEGRSR
ncbi:MAG: TIGR02206 family membrane protein [Chthoniobacterales bacterium]|nr:TIGR02206 family membrane protein [Chthoniobacterales bacterium]